MLPLKLDLPSPAVCWQAHFVHQLNDSRLVGSTRQLGVTVSEGPNLGTQYSPERSGALVDAPDSPDPRCAQVIAVMYELSEECNADLDQFWSLLPLEPGDAAFVQPVDLQAGRRPLPAAPPLPLRHLFSLATRASRGRLEGWNREACTMPLEACILRLPPGRRRPKLLPKLLDLLTAAATLTSLTSTSISPSASTCFSTS